MDTEKMMMQRRIDNLQKHIDYLYGELRDYERQSVRVKQLEAELEAVKQERDALKRDLYFECYDSLHACYVCKHGQDGVTLCQRAKEMDDCFEWRGLVKGNGGAE